MGIGPFNIWGRDYVSLLHILYRVKRQNCATSESRVLLTETLCHMLSLFVYNQNDSKANHTRLSDNHLDDTFVLALDIKNSDRDNISSLPDDKLNLIPIALFPTTQLIHVTLQTLKQKNRRSPPLWKVSSLTNQFLQKCET